MPDQIKYAGQGGYGFYGQNAFFHWVILEYEIT